MSKQNNERQRLVARKRKSLSAKLDEGRIQVRVNSCVDGVILPDFLMNRVQVTLNLSYGFQPEIFVIDDDGVQVSLSFSGEKVLCVIPWESLYFIHSLTTSGESAGDGEVFVESIPQELLEHYGLTIHIMEDDEEDIPITRPFREPLAAHEDTDEISLEEEIAELSELRDWVQSLEKIDHRRAKHHWPVPIEVIREVVEELDTQGLLDPDRAARSSKPDSVPRDGGRAQSVSNVKRERRFDLTSRRSKTDREGEHTPDRGIFSLRRSQTPDPSLEEEMASMPSTDSTKDHR